MAVTAEWYGNGAKNLMEGDVDLAVDTIKCALLVATHTFDKDTHEFWSDVSVDEASGTGYTAGGATLTTPTVTYDAANNRAVFDADDVTWANSTISAGYAVVYQDTGTATTSALLGIVNFGQEESSSDGDFQITWSADGILRITT